MSEPIPESIPTSHDPRSQRPTKRQALTPRSQQASSVEALFANPDRTIRLPDGAAKPSSGLAPPPEIVANVQGSSAGAGSGEFHVYKASRRREYERLRAMDQEVQAEKDQEEFERQRAEKLLKEGKKSSKNRARRDKAKERKAGKGAGGGARLPDPKGPGKMDVEKELDGDRRPPRAPEAGAGAEGTPVEEEIGVVIHDED